MQLSKLLFVLTHCPWFYYEGSCYQSAQISWCVGFKGQGSMYQALVSYFELFDNFVTIRIIFITAEEMFGLIYSIKIPWGGGDGGGGNTEGKFG